MIKVVDKQQDKEVHRAGSGRIPSAGASVPVDLVTTLPAHGSFHQPGSFVSLIL